MTEASAPTIRLYRSNRTEALVEVLAELCAAPSADPFDREWVVVQGRGMAVWLAQQMARRQGVWAGSEVLYPRNFVTRAMEVVLGEEAKGGGALSRETLLWPLMALLGNSSGDPALSRLTRYLEGESPQLRRYQLAARVADVFDQYLTYRPDMLLAWEREDDGLAIGHGEDWQPRLWRQLVERLGDKHLASLERRLLQALSAADTRLLGRLPSRIVVFGLASMPPLYVRVLGALAGRTEVHWLLPSPAAGYWADLASPARIERALAQGGSVAELHLDRGNPLLASLGKLGADLLEVMESELEALGVAQQEPRGDLHREPPSDSRLGRLQADVLHLRQGERRDLPADPSISIHACHGPMREVEVLHDQLLALLTGGGDLRPHDVVVMMPDVDTYAPLVEAVFERDRKDERFIPHCIADRSLRRESPVTDALLRVLDLAGGRLPASQLLDLLAVEPLRRRFGIGADDLDTISRWVVDGQIRWGIDASHRARHGQPAVEQNTWRQGLTRLLLGYAMPGEGRSLFAGHLPYDEIEGQEAQLLGRFAAFCDLLFGAVERLEQPRSLGAWRDELVALLAALLAEDSDNAWEHDRVRQVLADLCAAAAAGSNEEAFGVEVVRAAITAELAGLERAQGFLRAGVTFCAMLPMRSIPFRVVCLLGMSDGVFPRARHTSEIDLMTRRGEARPGDRNRRDDDRYAFLEAVLAARERLIITYTGQSIRDNSSRDPSVVVSELVDYLAKCECIADADSHALTEWPSRDPLVTRHPLQPFSPRYFDGGDPRLFSFSAVDCAGAVSLTRASRAAVAPFLAQPLPAPSEELAEVLTLDELVAFFDHPARYLLRRRLGMDLGDREQDVPDREPVTLSGLDRYRIGDQLLTLDLAGVDAGSAAALVRAAGHLPVGSPGLCALEDVAAIVAPISDRLRRLCRQRAERVTIDGMLADGTRLGGQLDEVWECGPVVGQFSRVSGRHLLSLWIRHLAYCWELGRRGSSAGQSFLVGRGPSPGDEIVQVRLRPVERPEQVLSDLVALRRLGQREPLPLVPKVAYRYARAVRRRGDGQQGRALDTAWRELADEHAADPHLRRAFASAHALRGTDEIPTTTPSFAVLARSVFDPLLDHLDEARSPG